MDGSEAYTARARYAHATALYEGTEYDLSDYLESLSYTDNASGTLDQITLVLDLDGMDRHGAGGWEPEKGKDLDVTIYMENWYVNGVQEKYHCGNFVIDDITISGGPSRMTLKGISQPANSDLKERKRTKTWQKVTLKQITQEIMDKYGMSKLYFNCDDVLIESVEQSNQTDLDFLKAQCEKYGLSIKCYKVGFVIFDETWYESGGTFNYFGLYPKSAAAGSNAGYEDWPTHEIQPNYSWNATLQGTYTGATLKYTSGKKGDTIETTVGTDERLLYINEKADSLAEAEKIAKSKVNEANKKQITLTFSPSLFSPGLFASYCVDIVNLPRARCNGKYYVEKVAVSLNGSGGLTETVTTRKLCTRL